MRRAELIGTVVAAAMDDDHYIKADLEVHLATHGFRIPEPETLEILRQCDSFIEVLFALPFTSLPGFKPRSPDTFTIPGAALVFQFEIDRYRADFVLVVDGLKHPTVIEIDGEKWHYDSPEQWRKHLERQRFIERQGFVVKRVPAREAEKFSRKLWVALAKDLDSRDNGGRW